ncbi:MAG TPA: uroporphyrinogen decarboxylase [Candidatus Micrarchaeia archaeon]|nr:uroporphyrinogen decarboxylase [Candidatus Micrarchaeia archaeon]
MASVEPSTRARACPGPMTGSARLLAACAHRPVDATPVWFMRQAGRSLPAYRRLRERHDLLTIARTPELATAATLMPVDRLGVDAAVLFADIMLPLTGMGVPFEIRPGTGPVVPDPIRSETDLRRLRVADPAEATPYVLETIRAVRRELGDRAALVGFAGGPFTLACYCVEGHAARDFPRARGWLHADPVAFATLMTVLTDTTIRYCAAQVEAGAQVVQLFESWAGVLAPADFDRHVAPHLRRIVLALRGLVPVIVFATGATHLLGSLARLGSPGLSLDWRVPLDQGWRAVGHDRFVQGNLDPAVCLGPWSVVQPAAEAVLRLAGGRPGHIFNLGHGVDPATDPDCLRRLVELVHAAGPVGTPG